MDYLIPKLKDYPDQRLRSNVVEGIRLESDPELMALFSPQLVSIGIGYGSVQKTVREHKELGFYDNSVVVFTSDHGEEFFEHDGVGHGRTLYDEQIRIPLIIKSDRIERGEHSGRVQLIDLYPTIIDTGYRSALRT